VNSETIPDLNGWEAYCDECGTFCEVRRAEERDASTGSEYFEFVCNTCHSILLTLKRHRSLVQAERSVILLIGRTGSQGVRIAANRTSSLASIQIMVFICRHCGQGVGASQPVH
jgi:hypothetical protein